MNHGAYRIHGKRIDGLDPISANGKGSSGKREISGKRAGPNLPHGGHVERCGICEFRG
jgi:hypothetical protein